MKKVKELFNRKLILSIIGMFVIAGLSFVYISNTNKELKKSEVYDLEVEEKKTNNLEIDETIKYITIDIKGEVKSPGVYKIEEGKRVVDQTTPNMIQRIIGIFERKPLISKEI